MRLIRSGALSPALNLALDEALLRSGRGTLRFYAWEPPGFSLGVFQNAAQTPAPPGFVLVRRPTGGGAIAHAGELTLSWVGARRAVEVVYRDVNRLVSAGLASLGVSTEAGAGEPEAAPIGLCFDAHTRYDLLAEGGKLFGSAQRRGGGKYLLHGSLVVRPNPWAKGARSLEEVLGRSVENGEVEDALIRAARVVWGVEFSPEDPTPEEWEEAARLIAEKYSNDSWTERR